MKRFQRDDKPGRGRRTGGGGGPRRFGGGRGGPGARDFGKPQFDKQLHPAVCSICGNPCQVPFKPSGDRPIFCRDCFRKEGGGGPERPRFGRREERPERGGFREPGRPDQLQRELEKINDKLDRIIKAIEGNE